jgi:hypothetical protein
LERTYRKNRLHHLFYCCVTSPRTRKLRAIHSNGSCLQSHLLATGLYATICIIYVYILVISLVYWSPWSGSYLGGYDVMNSCIFTCVISHLFGIQVGCSGTIVETLLSCGIWRIPVLSCMRPFGVCRSCCVSGNISLHRVGCSCNNDLDSYSGDSQFESRLRH